MTCSTQFIGSYKACDTGPRDQHVGLPSRRSQSARGDVEYALLGLIGPEFQEFA